MAVPLHCWALELTERLPLKKVRLPKELLDLVGLVAPLVPKKAVLMLRELVAPLPSFELLGLSFLELLKLLARLALVPRGSALELVEVVAAPVLVQLQSSALALLELVPLRE